MNEQINSYLSDEELAAHQDQMLSDEQRKKMMQESADTRQIIEQSKTLAYDTNFSVRYEDLEEYRPEVLRNQLFPLIKGGVLIDLGCGIDFRLRSLPQSVLELAQRAEAAKYIGVEKYGNPHNEYFEIRYPNRQIEIEIHGDTDMLQFLLTIPDNTANITINGIDDEIIDDSIPENEKYLEALVKEVIRVAGRDHIIFGIGSKVIFEMLGKRGLKRETLEDTVEIFRSNR